MTISLCVFAKNESNCIGNMIASVKDHIDEVVLVDTGSNDLTYITASCAVPVGIPFRKYNIGFTNFGEIRTITAHLAQMDWVLMLDADETLSNPEKLADVITASEVSKINAWSFSRFRWLDLEMTQQTELEAFPDPQVRFFRNDKSFVWKRELHEYFHGATVYHADLGPSINHFHDVYKTSEKKAERKEQYERLAAIAGVTPEGGHAL